MNKKLVTRQENRELTVDHPFNEWLRYELQRGASELTIKAYKKGYQVFGEWVESKGIKNIDPPVVRQFKADLSKSYAPQTVNLRLSAVRSYFRFLVNTNRLEINPAASVKGVKRPKGTPHRRDTLTSEEVKRVFDTCDISTDSGIRDQAILSLMAYCALRTIEIQRASLDNLKTSGDRLVLWVQGKGHTEPDDRVVIPKHQENCIRDWVAVRRKFGDGNALFVSLSRRNTGDRLTARSILRMVTKRFEAAGVVQDQEISDKWRMRSKTTHSLRHTAISNAIKNGGTPLQVQKMARHTSFDTTLKYIHEVNRIDSPAEDLIQY